MSDVGLDARLRVNGPHSGEGWRCQPTLRCRARDFTAPKEYAGGGETSDDGGREGRAAMGSLAMGAVQREEVAEGRQGRRRRRAEVRRNTLRRA
jgi:hypothetical protein